MRPHTHVPVIVHKINVAFTIHIFVYNCSVVYKINVALKNTTQKLPCVNKGLYKTHDEHKCGLKTHMLVNNAQTGQTPMYIIMLN